MNVLFVLLPAGLEPDTWLATLPPDTAAATRLLRMRRYPAAASPAHLHSLLRAGRDPLATTRWRGALLAIAGGAVLGGLVNGVLAGRFGLFGGMLELALPLGLGTGAFLGGFTAAMTGTEVPRAELRPLLAAVQPGATLLQWTGPDRAPLLELARAGEPSRLPIAWCPA
ncbi:MAG: hypothetical protein MUC36_05955 [Planctomycetes bacterium]|nr:hypothetical protein [Planctomycetota bacterium]